MPATDLLEQHVSKAASLSEDQVATTVRLLDVIRVLNRARISFVLVGAYGLAGWIKKPRATEDVDVVVAVKHLKKAVNALLVAFPHLEPVDLPVVVRLRERGTDNVVIDVMKPLQQPYRDVFHHTVTLSSEKEDYRVPTLEMALVMKFVAMTSLYRADADKYMDAHDFIYMVQGNPEIDLAQLHELGCLIYPDGGKAVVEMVRKVRAGEKLQI